MDFVNIADAIATIRKMQDEIPGHAYGVCLVCGHPSEVGSICVSCLSRFIRKGLDLVGG